MGQTLSHGVYLPAEGERNCYSGLASNWNLLDTAIGDTAGKASATHTHGNISNDGKVGTTANLPLITGTGGAITAGAFGNQANTFCEGNDSRLSDARTPVAHTHTKSDVTDLLNSNFIPSANNSYGLGSSSYQWNNLYAKSYYYNGVAWGLDKANVWSNINTYQREICISGDRSAYIAPMWEGASSGIAFLNSDVTKTFTFGQHTIDANNRYIVDNTKGRVLIRTGERNGETAVDLEPRATNANLGTSTNKWKSFNGVNPGALSLPNTGSGVQMDITNWNNRASPDGIIGTFTASVDCIVSIQMTRVVDWGVWAITGNFRQTFRSAENNGLYLIFLTFPVAKGDSIYIYCPVIPADETPITFVANKQRYFPCLGNV